MEIVGIQILEGASALWYASYISNIVRKLNKEYMPLSVAVFLTVGALLIGAFAIPKVGVVKQKVAFTASPLIPQAQGAEIDSAALTVQDAPFLNAGNADSLSSATIENAATFYSDGAMKDPSSPLL